MTWMAATNGADRIRKITARLSRVPMRATVAWKALRRVMTAMADTTATAAAIAKTMRSPTGGHPTPQAAVSVRRGTGLGWGASSISFV